MKTIRKVTKFTLLITVFLSITSSCGVKDEIEDIVEELTQSTQDIEAIIDEAATKISANVSNFESILDEAVDKITDDQYDQIRDDLRDATANAVSLLGEEFRCNTQYIGDYLKKQLTKIKYLFKNEDTPPAEPGICQVIPNAIEMDRPANSIDVPVITGYFFDEAFENFELLLDVGNGIVDVSEHLHLTSNFRLTINLGSNGINLNKYSQKLTLMWDGKIYSEIPIIQPIPEPCNLKERLIINLPKIVLVPEHKAAVGADVPIGNKNFADDGPCVDGWVQLFIRNNELWLKAFVRMWQCPNDFGLISDDYTYGEVVKETFLKAPDAGYYIKRIKDNTIDEFKYIDHSQSIDETIAGGGPVLSYKIVGDTPGDDVGGDSRLEITLRPIEITLEEVGDCVPNPGKRDFLDDAKPDTIVPPFRIAPLNESEIYYKK